MADDLPSAPPPDSETLPFKAFREIAALGLEGNPFLCGAKQLANEYSLLRSIGPYLGGPNISALRTAAARTGGALYENPSNTQLPAIFKRVLDDFRSSYVLTFAPTGVARPGWHDLTVRVTNTKFSVRARKGYDGG